MAAQGRPLSYIWKNELFTYDPVTQKSICKIAFTDKDGVVKTCDKAFAGKNTSNLEKHLRFRHNETYETMVAQKFNEKLAKTQRLSKVSNGKAFK